MAESAKKGEARGKAISKQGKKDGPGAVKAESDRKRPGG